MKRDATVDDLLTEETSRELLLEEQTPMDASLQKLLQTQVTNELANQLRYKQMSFVMEQKGFKGFSRFFSSQAQDEANHSTMISEYLKDRDILPVIESVPAPKVPAGSPREAVTAALDFEKQTTKQIWAIRDKADSVKDAATHQWIQWLVIEQVEEEKTLQDLINRLDIAGDDKAALLEIDEEAGNRFGGPCCMHNKY